MGEMGRLEDALCKEGHLPHWGLCYSAPCIATETREELASLPT